MSSTSRRRFTCAHEIGHYLRRPNQAAAIFIDERSDLAGLGVDVEEVFANQFAAALVMPATLVRQQVRAGKSVAEMAAYFVTSPPALTRRLRNLRLTAPGR